MLSILMLSLLYTICPFPCSVCVRPLVGSCWLTGRGVAAVSSSSTRRTGVTGATGSLGLGLALRRGGAALGLMIADRGGDRGGERSITRLRGGDGGGGDGGADLERGTGTLLGWSGGVGCW